MQRPCTLILIDANAPISLSLRTLSTSETLVVNGAKAVPIAKAYPLAEVRGADKELEQRHTRGKIVLVPSAMR
jgi:NADPH:quinone reductase-like Zn-dependent oxidoreductase